MLIDTSTLLRTLQPRHAQHEAATRALEVLPERGRELHIVPQNLIELWVVATRPVEQNGLGLSSAAAATELRRLKRMLPLLPETPALFQAWERLVAAMQVHGLTAILTFDKSGFSRYPGIEVLHPADVIPSA